MIHLIRSLCCLLACGVVSILSAAPVRVVVATDSAEVRTVLARLFETRGAQVTTTTAPDESTLGQADALILHRANFDPLPAASQSAVAAFAQKGGGLLALQGGIAALDPATSKRLFGGAWNREASRKFNSRMMLYVAQDNLPIIREASSFDLTDDTLYDLDMAPEVHVLGCAFTPKVTGLRGDRRERAEKNAKADRASVFDLQAQMWSYQRAGDARSFVALQCSDSSLNHPSIQAFLLRAVAWTSKRPNVDELCKPEEIAALRYPKDGPSKPEDTIRQIELPDGFTLSVVASEPLINKPIAVNWDARGRLWVAETPEYPNGRRPSVAEPWKETNPLKPGVYDRPATDRISILEDTNGDGLMDKKTLFYEGLELVTGFCFHRDGVIAIHNPDIVFLRDTDGDDKADKTERLFTGFTPGDTHFVANHLIQGYDGWIYVSMGGGQEVRKPDSKEILTRVSSGVFRFRPDGSAIEQFSSKGGNGFGLDVTSDGEVFFGQATSGSPVQHVVLPESTLSRGKVGNTGSAHPVINGRKVARTDMPDRAPLMQIDVVGGYSSACASLIYEGGAWPAAYHRGVFCTEPILNIIHHEYLRPQGPTFTGEMRPADREFARGRDYWFRPFDLAPGPDGAVYIIDFYTPVVAHSDSRGPQHGKAGATVRPDRDHYFGRIYRLHHKEAKTLTVPDLSKANAVALAAALQHPNRTVRFTAFQRLVEKGGSEVVSAVTPLIGTEMPAITRIPALWTLHRLGALTPAGLKAAFTDAGPTVRKAAALIVESTGQPTPELAAGVKDPDPHTRRTMLRALAATGVDDHAAAALVALYPSIQDDWTRSAAVAAAATDPAAVCAAALHATNAPALGDFLAAIAARMVEKQDRAAFARLLPNCADAPASVDKIKAALLEAAGNLSSAPESSADLTAALRKLLSSANPRVATAALPLAATWTRDLQNEVKQKIPALLAELSQPTKEDRYRQLTVALIGARSASPEVLPAIGAFLLSDAPSPAKRQAISALGKASEEPVRTLLITTYPKLPPSEQDATFNAILARPEWTLAFIDALEGGKFAPNLLGPSNAFRLRTHPSKDVATRATKVLESFRKTTSNKDAVIAQLLPAVTQPGNAAKGRELFNATCAACHKFNDLGTELGPVLTGMGAHGVDNLLVHIVDPNRAVDAGYEIWNVETKDGQFHAGMLAQENDARMVLRMPGEQVEIPKDRIKSRTNTHRSLMPEGLEAIGAEALRDLLTFLAGDANRFRILDLSGVHTADTRRGLYESAEAVRDTLFFKKFGLVNVEGVPFFITDPTKSTIGSNVLILKGGGRQSFSFNYPKKVEIKVGVAAKSLHFLGGVAGWGAREATDGPTIMTATLVFAGGETETAKFRNGVEFIDYVSDKEVPGSKRVDELMSDHQIRWFTLPVKSGKVIEKLILESPGEGPAPTTVSITAELPGH